MEELVREILAGRDDGLGLDRVEWKREGRDWSLRVVLDHADRVTVDHCAEVARELGRALDEHDLIDHAYNLEVSSPGIERPLVKDSDFERFAGRQATLHFYRAVDGRKAVTGRLLGLTPEGDIRLEVAREGAAAFARSLVSRAHLAVDWSGLGSGREANGGGDE